MDKETNNDTPGEPPGNRLRPDPPPLIKETSGALPSIREELLSKASDAFADAESVYPESTTKMSDDEEDDDLTYLGEEEENVRHFNPDTISQNLTDDWASAKTVRSKSKDVTSKESDLDDLKELSYEKFDFASKLVKDIVDQSMRYDEPEEIPEENDLTVEQLEEEEPLSEWITSLLPNMRDIVPSFSHPEEEMTEEEEEEEEEVPREELFDFDPSEAPNVLVTDSPLMKRFQEALRNHLLRQKERLVSDIFNLEAECRKTVKEKDILGETIYREQQHILKQSAMIKKYKSGINEVTKKLENCDRILKAQAIEHKEISKEYNETVQEDKTLIDQNEEIAELLRRLASLEAAQNTELKFSKNLSDKQKLDKIKMAKEKQQQDMLIWKLTRELNDLTQGTEAFIEQATEKKKEIGVLQQCIANVEADTSGLIKENNLINAATERLINELKYRDKANLEAENQLKVGYAQVQLINSRIRSYNKSINSEIEQFNYYSQRKDKAEKTLHRVSNSTAALREKKEALMTKLAEDNSMIVFTEEELRDAVLKHRDLTKKYSSLIADLDELTSKRNQMEQQFASVMSEKKIQSTSYQNLQKVISELGKENQDVGLLKLENDCKIGQLMMDIEKAKVTRIQVEVKIESLKNLVKEKETELKAIGVNRQKIHEKTVSLTSKVIGAKKRLVLVNKMTDESESRCLAVKRIAALKIELEKLDTKVQEARKMWMETQNSLIEDNLKLSQLEVSTNTIRKHLFLTTYKKEKLEAKLEEAEREEKKTRRQLSTYQRKLNVLTTEILKVEENCDKLASVAKATEGKYIEALQDAETATVRLQQEICEMKENNAEMEDEVEQLQRELLAWEKKWKMAVEAKDRLDKEKAMGGEIGNMKIEIHRMQVRFAQLKKVQDKLTQDLELSIARRDNIIDQAYAREKRSDKGKLHTKAQFNKKLEETKSRIKSTTQAIKKIEKESQMLEIKRYDLMQEIDRKREELNQLMDGVSKLEMEIQEGQLHKYKSLELIVRRQRKIRFLEDIKTNKYRLSFKQESSLLNEEEKQNIINSNLIEVVESLMADFPPLKLQTMQIINTLTLVID